MTTSFNVGKSAYTRVFLIDGKAGPAHAPEYQSCMRAGSISQSFGDIESIECPSETEWGQFDEVDTIRGAVERATSSLVGNYAADLASVLFEMAKQRCMIDIHVNFGECTDPRNNNKFLKKLIWENAALSSYSTDDLGALGSGDNAAITETVDLSIGEIYQVLELTFQECAANVVTNELVDAVICDIRSCGDCDDPSPGCNKAFVLQGGQTGSPGTAPDVVYTEDMGSTWGIDEINSMTASAADALACVGDNLIVVSNAEGSLHYKEKDDILDGTVGGWVEVATGFVGGGEPNDIWSVGIGAFIVGDGGYVYWVESPSDGVTVLDAGVAVTDNLLAVHALSDTKAVAVGETDGLTGAVLYTINGTSWSEAAASPSAVNLTGVWMRTEDEWWVTAVDGSLFYTTDGGASWTEKTLPGANVSALYDVQFQTPSVGYVAGVAGGAGALWRTYDGGYSWMALPEGAGSLVGDSTQMTAIAACAEDPNYLIAAGEDVASDGVLLVGVD